MSRSSMHSCVSKNLEPRLRTCRCGNLRILLCDLDGANPATRFFLILSIFLEIRMNRNSTRASRPSRQADDSMYPGKPNHYGGPPAPQGLRGLVAGALPFRSTRNPDSLPMHQQPSQVTTRHELVEEWGEVHSLSDGDRVHFNDGRASSSSSSRDSGQEVPIRFNAKTAPRPAADVYIEGDEHVKNKEYNLDMGDTRGHSSSEIGTGSQQWENQGARVERFGAAYS